jgi:hypothetical protein
MSSLHSDRCCTSIRCGASLALLCVLLSANSGGQRRSPSAAPTSAHTADARERLLSVPVASPSPVPLPAPAIAAKLVAASARRSSQLRGFRATRDYHLLYHGLFGSREASMQVLATYAAPDKYEYQVLSQTGSKLLMNRVLLKLVDSERDALKNRSQVELSPVNYEFSELGMETLNGSGPSYILGVLPRKDNKFLYRGKIWVDAGEFALVRMQGQPAKSPSFWVKETDIDSSWQKVNGFWFIHHTLSVSHIRLGGTATLTIDYHDYQITELGTTKGHAQSPQLPDPGSVTPQH